MHPARTAPLFFFDYPENGGTIVRNVGNRLPTIVSSCPCNRRIRNNPWKTERVMFKEGVVPAVPHMPNTVIPRLTKIIRSGITFVSRNVISHQPSRVGGSPLCDVVSSFLCHTHTDGKDKLLEWPTVHVCCFMLARASTKTFVSRVRKTAKKSSLAEKFLTRVTR